MVRPTLSVLAIDDDLVDLGLLARLLGQIERYEIDLLRAHNSRSARIALCQRRVDLVFLDYMLGTEDGLEVLTAIRQSGTRCPVIFMTGRGSEGVAARAQRAGLTDYLPKAELTLETLTRAVDLAVDAWQAEQARTAYEEMLTKLAAVDELTGLLNRRAFLPLLEQECARTARYDRPLALMAVDVDDFPRIVRSHGRVAAEQILSSFSVLLRGALRTTDHYCRYEGNRFCVILTETDRSLAVRCAERIQAYCKEAPISGTDAGAVPVTCTIAVRPVLPGDTNADGLVHQTFRALSVAGAEGGDRYVVVEP